MTQQRPRSTDPVLLVEAAGVLVLFALLVYLYLIPTESAGLVTPWWTAPVLGALFLGLVALEVWRRRRGNRRALREALDRERERLDAPRRD